MGWYVGRVWVGRWLVTPTNPVQLHNLLTSLQPVLLPATVCKIFGKNDRKSSHSIPRKSIFVFYSHWIFLSQTITDIYSVRGETDALLMWNIGCVVALYAAHMCPHVPT